MCHQTVGLIAGEIEKRGMKTVSVSIFREATEKVRPPRAVFFDFPFGSPLGRPNDTALQMSVIRQTLATAHAPGPEPVLEMGSIDRLLFS